MTQDIRSPEHPTGKNTLSRPAAPLQNRRRNYYPLAWLEEPYNQARGETALWVAVITQAMMDALSRANHAEALYYKHEAIHWLTGNSKDFIMVCTCAGLDPDYVRRKAKRTLVAPLPWRAEPGKGKRYLECKKYRKKPGKPSEEKDCARSCGGGAHADAQELQAGSNVILLHGNAIRRV